ncbi:hypothetical protein [Halorubrum luteum]
MSRFERQHEDTDTTPQAASRLVVDAGSDPLRRDARRRLYRCSFDPNPELTGDPGPELTGDAERPLHESAVHHGCNAPTASRR